MDISEKIQASSHSGAILKVQQKKDEYFVEKIIATSIVKNFNAILKQQKFEPIITSTYKIMAIPVTSIEKTDDKLVITMPYIEGLGGEQVAYKGSKNVAKNLKAALNFYFLNNTSSSKDDKIEVKVIHDKVDSIINNLDERWNLFPDLKEHISKFKDFCKKDLQLPIGTCHGDLTLSNLKITENNELALFDFLSCDINSPLQDAAKIVQDFEYGWSFRHEKKSVKLKGEIFCEHAFPCFIKTFERLFFYEMRIIEILTILRIAPYIKESDETTINWFNRSINKAVNKIVG